MLGNMTFIRNRAAHFDPVFRRKFTNDIAEARRLMRWIDPNEALWFDETLKFDSIVAAESNLCVVPSGIASSSSAQFQ